MWTTWILLQNRKIPIETITDRQLNELEKILPLGKMPVEGFFIELLWTFSDVTAHYSDVEATFSDVIPVFQTCHGKSQI
jgi:hypothetical protein